MLKHLWKRRRRLQFDRTDFDTLFEDDQTLIMSKQQSSERCIVSFTGVGHGMGGLDLQSPEFSSSRLVGSRIFIIDKDRSWGNALNWPKVESIVLDFAKGQELITIGNSMGGFLAILGSKRLKAAYSIAFAPQWSVDPQIVPLEDRWNLYVKEIAEFKFPDLRESFAQNCRYLVVFGDAPEDVAHAKLFETHTSLAPDGNIEIMTVADAGHNVAKYLKESGILHDAILAGLSPVPGLESLRQENFAFELSRRHAMVRWKIKNSTL